MNRSRKTVILVLLAACAAAMLASPAFADGKNIEKVLGSITAENGQTYGDLETVNGSIHIETGATLEDAETVNGSIKAGDNIRARSLSTVNGNIRLGTRARVEKSVETVNGSVFIDRGSRIGGDIENVNGSIGLVHTQVGGSIETARGDITVGAGSHVKGGIHVEKTHTNWIPSTRQEPLRIVIGPDAIVDGPLVFEQVVKLYVHTSAHIGKVTGATTIAFSTAEPPKD